MPGQRTDTRSGFAAGSTLFEQMQRRTHAPTWPEGTDPASLTSAMRDLIVIEDAPTIDGGSIRFDRAEVDGVPGVVMQRRNDEGQWATIWSLPAQSMDAREGTIGWLNGHAHRWERFARMLERRGPEELTAWIYELMVVPSTSQARAPRFEPQPAHVTIDAYGRAVWGCSCRPAGMQQARRGGYC